MNKEKQNVSVKRSLAIVIGLAIVSTPLIAKETQSMSPIIQQYCVLCHNDVILQADGIVLINEIPLNLL